MPNTNSRLNDTKKNDNPEIDEDTSFYKTLDSYKTVFFYNNKFPLSKIFNNYADAGSMTVDLSVHPALENQIISHYGIERLPCMITKKVNEETGKIENKILYTDDPCFKRETYSEKKIDKRIRNAAMTEDDKIYYKKITQEKLDSMLEDDVITMFVKGTPSRPECGFTRQLVDLINSYNSENGIVQYKYFNIFEDEKIRAGLKLINDWPTIPQVYLGKKFIGGLDVLRDMKDQNMLNEKMEKFIK